jgi:hypothetical protein
MVGEGVRVYMVDEVRNGDGIFIVVAQLNDCILLQFHLHVVSGRIEFLYKPA